MRIMIGLARVRFVFRSLALLLALGGAATATTLVRMSVEQMSHTAEAIVRAHCLGNSTGWDAGEIWTFTSFGRAGTVARIDAVANYSASARRASGKSHVERLGNSAISSG